MKCIRCGIFNSEDVAGLCAACQRYVTRRWPNGFTPLDEAEPWMEDRAKANIASATATFDKLVGEYVAHLYRHTDCPAYCTGGRVSHWLAQADLTSLRMFSLAAVRSVAFEIWRNDKVEP